MRKLTVVLLCLLLAACAGSAPTQPLRIGDAPFADGESARYAVTFNGDPMGSALWETAARIDPATGTQDGWTVRRQLDRTGEQEIVVIDVGPTGFRPIESTMVRVLPDGVEQVHATYDGSSIQLDLTTRRNVTTNQELSMPSDVREDRSLPWIVRMLPLQAGYGAEINALQPIVGRMARFKISVGRPESVTVPAGTFEAYNVMLDPGVDLSRVWVGVDAPHPVVKYLDGRTGLLYELDLYSP